MAKNAYLSYEITPTSKVKNSARQYTEMVEALEAIGVYLKVEGTELTIWLSEDIYNRKVNRNAGRRKKKVWDETQMEIHKSAICGIYETNKLWRQSDIVYMLQTMTDKEIMARIGMSHATYYRHKKDLLGSDYYKSLDKNKLNDKEYLIKAAGLYDRPF